MAANASGMTMDVTVSCSSLKGGEVGVSRGEAGPTRGANPKPKAARVCLPCGESGTTLERRGRGPVRSARPLRVDGIREGRGARGSSGRAAPYQGGTPEVHEPLRGLDGLRDERGRGAKRGGGRSAA